VLVAVIVACEIGFWLVLGAGLVARYLLRRDRLGAWLLAGVPAVDAVLLVVTVLDLRRGGTAGLAHGLAALYLGFSLVFGHGMVRWADVRFAHRFAGGPPPPAKPGSGSRARLRLEWQSFGKACAAAGISAVLLLGAIALVGDRGDTSALLGWFPRLGLVLVIWLLTGPAWEAGRLAVAGDRSIDDTPARIP
jgi:hypothetical protein